MDPIPGVDVSATPCFFFCGLSASCVFLSAPLSAGPCGVPCPCLQVTDDYLSERKEVLRTGKKKFTKNEWLAKAVLGGKLLKVRKTLRWGLVGSSLATLVICAGVQASSPPQ